MVMDIPAHYSIGLTSRDTTYTKSVKLFCFVDGLDISARYLDHLK